MDLNEYRKAFERQLGMKSGELSEEDFTDIVHKVNEVRSLEDDDRSNLKGLLDDILENLRGGIQGTFTVDNGPIDSIIDQIKKKLKDKKRGA